MTLDTLSMVKKLESLIMCLSMYILQKSQYAYKKLLGFVMRNSKHLNDVYAISFLLNGTARSKPVYASIKQSPVHKSYQNQIQDIQKRFLRYLFYNKYNKSAYQNKISYIKLERN
jgi:hypothetical protein